MSGPTGPGALGLGHGESRTLGRGIQESACHSLVTQSQDAQAQSLICPNTIHSLTYYPSEMIPLASC